MMGKLSKDNWCMEHLHYNMLEITPQANPYSPFFIPEIIPIHNKKSTRGSDHLALGVFDSRPEIPKGMKSPPGQEIHI